MKRNELRTNVIKEAAKLDKGSILILINCTNELIAAADQAEKNMIHKKYIKIVDEYKANKRMTADSFI